MASSQDSAFNSGLSGLGLSPGWEHCIMFLGEMPNSQNASLHVHVSRCKIVSW